MKKLSNYLLCIFAFLFMLNSCNHNKNDSGIQKDKKLDPPLVLKSLKILNQYVDLELMKCTAVSTITTDDITARFDYGDEKDEAIGVVVEADGGVFKVDKKEATKMKISVPAVKGRHLKWSGEVTVGIERIPMDVGIGYNESLQENGKEETLALENVELMVQAKEDIIKEVIINDGVQDHKVNVQYIPETKQQDDYWIATKILPLKMDNFTTFTITVKPKDIDIYLDTVYTYKLKGTTIPKNNAEFIFINDGNEESPNVICEIEWVEDCESQFYEDYGSMSLKMIARTVSPRASVYVKKVDPLSATEDLLSGETEMKLQNQDGVHTGNITLFEDKPTRLVAYVKAEDNITMNDTKGKWMLVFNSVDLFWDYDVNKLKNEETRKNAKKAYAEIEVEKTSVVNNKVYLAFSIWGEKLGFKLDESVTKMTDYKVLDTFGDTNYPRTAHQIAVDVASLTAGQSTEVNIPIMRFLDDEMETMDEPVKAFTYKIKVKIK